MKKYFLVLFPLFTVFNVIAQKDINRAIESQIEDFLIFKTTLKECHSGLYDYNDIEKINFLFNELEREIKNQSLKTIELLSLYSKFISNINCGHTWVRHKDFDKFLNLGINELNALFYYCDNQLFLRDGLHQGIIKIGSNDKIIEINGEYISSIKDSLFQYIPSDGKNLTLKEKRLRNDFFVFYGLYAPDKTNLKFKFIHNNDTLFTNIELNEVTFKTKPQKVIKKKQSKLTYSIDSARSTAFIRLPHPLPNDKKYKKELTNIFSNLNSLNIEYLVIDLQDNLGGKDQKHILEHFIKEPIAYRSLEYRPIHNATYKKYFWKKLRAQHLISNLAGRIGSNSDQFLEPKEQFKGKIFVLINGYTGSAASNLASLLKEHANAIIIGEESGGGYKFCNTGGAILKLPNSKVLVSIPSMKITNNVLNEYQKDGVSPHFEISDTCSVNDKNFDNYEFVYQYINSDKEK